MNKYLIYVLFLFFSQIGLSQSIDLRGLVKGNGDVENVHIVNKTSKHFTITNEKGAFTITAKLNDTLQFSSLLYSSKEIVVYKSVLEHGYVEVALENQVYSLDEVVLGKILSGDIMKDISSVDGEPITAKKLGIPSYQGKPLTLHERQLKDASDLDARLGVGFSPGMSMRIIPIINGLTGRTKRLKHIVDLDRNDALLETIRKRLQAQLFEDNPLSEELRNDFFYFFQSDEAFGVVCSTGNDLHILDFLNDKLNEYKSIKRSSH